MKTNQLASRFVALWVTLALALPSPPAFALRPTLNKTGLEEALDPSAGGLGELPLATPWDEATSAEFSRRLAEELSRSPGVQGFDDRYGSREGPGVTITYRGAMPSFHREGELISHAELWDGDGHRPVYFGRNGPLFFVNSTVQQQLRWLGPELQNRLGANLIWIEELGQSELANTRLSGHTEATVAAVRHSDLQGKLVIEAGSGRGIPALAAARVGASFLVLIDHDAEVLGYARRNLEGNGLKEGKHFSLIQAGLRDLKLIAQELKRLERPEKEAAIISNIGNWPKLYEVTNADAMALIPILEQATDVRVTCFIGAGYFKKGRSGDRTDFVSDRGLIHSQYGFLDPFFEKGGEVYSELGNTFAMAWIAVKAHPGGGIEKPPSAGGRPAEESKKQAGLEEGVSAQFLQEVVKQVLFHLQWNGGRSWWQIYQGLANVQDEKGRPFTEQVTFEQFTDWIIGRRIPSEHNGRLIPEEERLKMIRFLKEDAPELIDSVQPDAPHTLLLPPLRWPGGFGIESEERIRFATQTSRLLFSKEPPVPSSQESHSVGLEEKKEVLQEEVINYYHGLMAKAIGFKRVLKTKYRSQDGLVEVKVRTGKGALLGRFAVTLFDEHRVPLWYITEHIVTTQPPSTTNIHGRDLRRVLKIYKRGQSVNVWFFIHPDRKRQTPIIEGPPLYEDSTRTLTLEMNADTVLKAFTEGPIASPVTLQLKQGTVAHIPLAATGLEEGLRVLKSYGQWVEQEARSQVAKLLQERSLIPYFEGANFRWDEEKGFVDDKRRGFRFRGFVMSVPEDPLARELHFHWNKLQGDGSLSNWLGVFLRIDGNGTMQQPMWLEPITPFLNIGRDVQRRFTQVPVEVETSVLARVDHDLQKTLGIQWRKLVLKAQPLEDVGFFASEPILANPDNMAVFLESLEGSEPLQRLVSTQDWAKQGGFVEGPEDSYVYPFVVTGQFRRTLRKDLLFSKVGEYFGHLRLKVMRDFHDAGVLLLQNEQGPLVVFSHGMLLVREGASFVGRGEELERSILLGAELSVALQNQLNPRAEEQWPPGPVLEKYRKDDTAVVIFPNVPGPAFLKDVGHQLVLLKITKESNPKEPVHHLIKGLESGDFLVMDENGFRMEDDWTFSLTKPWDQALKLKEGEHLEGLSPKQHRGQKRWEWNWNQDEGAFYSAVAFSVRPRSGGLEEVTQEQIVEAIEKLTKGEESERAQAGETVLHWFSNVWKAQADLPAALTQIGLADALVQALVNNLVYPLPSWDWHSESLYYKAQKVRSNAQIALAWMMEFPFYRPILAREPNLIGFTEGNLNNQTPEPAEGALETLRAFGLVKGNSNMPIALFRRRFEKEEVDLFKRIPAETTDVIVLPSLEIYCSAPYVAVVETWVRREGFGPAQVKIAQLRQFQTHHVSGSNVMVILDLSQAPPDNTPWYAWIAHLDIPGGALSYLSFSRLFQEAFRKWDEEWGVEKPSRDEVLHVDQLSDGRLAIFV